jgi:ActR/RegA family two-component response regulator
VPMVEPLAVIERRHIETTLALCNGNKSVAAKALGMPRRSLQRKLAENPPWRTDSEAVPLPNGQVDNV